MNKQDVQTKLLLDEEVKPHPEPKEKTLYNSPPSFGGRYLLLNSGSRPIQSSDFSILKQNNWISYWNDEYLEDMDLFYEQTGWRLTKDGVDYLQKRGYKVEINTIEAKQEAQKKSKVIEVEKKRQKALEKERLDQQFKQITGEIKATLKGLTFHGQGMENKFKDTDYLSEKRDTLIVRESNPEAYTEYGFTLDGRVFIFVKAFFDMWGSECSDQKAPKQYAELIKKLQK